MPSPAVPARPAGNGRTRAPRGGALGVALALAGALGMGCLSGDQDLHLSPLYSNLSTAGGGREVEALAGALRIRHPTPDGPWADAAVRPLASRERYSDGTTLARFLVPLGTDAERADERVTQLLPLSRFQKWVDPQGNVAWKFFSLPGIFWSKDGSGKVRRAVFPFGGRIEGSFTFDRITFVLFPLFVQTEREGRRTWHFPWPIFAYSVKEGLPDSWRAWPLAGVTHSEFYTRRFWLWPLFHTQRNRPANMPREQEDEKRWSFWPIFSFSRRGSYRAWSWLWPFFGYSHDPESGFWAWDGPWPLIRIQRPGTETDVAYRTRIWPLYSYYNGDELESTWVLWPLINLRRETYRNGSRKAEFVVPFWQRWKRVDSRGEMNGAWNKLWPVYQLYWEPGGARFAFPALNPLWHMPVVDDHYAWIYEIYTRAWDASRERERAWGGLWRRETDRFERRTYVSGLWARRVYADGGETVAETALLFGLLRWRSRAGGLEGLLSPALPGPGFPHMRSAEPMREGP